MICHYALYYVITQTALSTIRGNVFFMICHYACTLTQTALSTIRGNVFFNGPRAGINANDGFGGGDVISRNLVFSTCRESGDHGPFNSWDRQVN